MSIEANTCEMLLVNNTNEKTTMFLKKVGEYLLKTWGIVLLKLSADGIEYETSDDSIREGTDLYNACRNLHEAADVKMYLRSCNGGGLGWRHESGFLSVLDNAEELKADISYKSTDYYDTDPGVLLCSFDENGFFCPVSHYADGIDGVTGIREWYCYTPEVVFSSETQKDNEVLHEVIRKNLERILSSVFGFDEDEIEDRLEDDWEDYGEIVLNGSISFSSDRIGELNDALSGILDEVQKFTDVSSAVVINAVPCGEGDYEFAVLSIQYEDGNLNMKSCRI